MKFHKYHFLQASKILNMIIEAVNEQLNSKSIPKVKKKAVISLEITAFYKIKFFLFFFKKLD